MMEHYSFTEFVMENSTPEYLFLSPVTEGVGNVLSTMYNKTKGFIEKIIAWVKSLIAKFKNWRHGKKTAKDTKAVVDTGTGENIEVALSLTSGSSIVKVKYPTSVMERLFDVDPIALMDEAVSEFPSLLEEVKAGNMTADEVRVRMLDKNRAYQEIDRLASSSEHSMKNATITSTQLVELYKRVQGKLVPIEFFKECERKLDIIRNSTLARSPRFMEMDYGTEGLRILEIGKVMSARLLPFITIYNEVLIDVYKAEEYL